MKVTIRIVVDEDIAILKPSEQAIQDMIVSRTPGDGRGPIKFTQSAPLDEGGTSSSAGGMHPVLLLIWFQEHTAKTLMDLGASRAFTMQFPPTQRRILRGQEDGLVGMGVTVVIRTRNEQGILARRRIGTAVVPWSHLLGMGDGGPFDLTPLVNSRAIHSMLSGKVSVVVSEPPRVMYHDSPGVGDLPSARELVSQFISRETDDFGRHRMLSEEVKMIRSQAWRTPGGFCPTLFYLWARRARNQRMDPQFFYGALLLACNRLGISITTFMKMPDERTVEVVGTAISSVVTMSPYLTDMARVKSYSGGPVARKGVEHFASSAETNSLDCEDGSVVAAGTLWVGLSRGNWKRGAEVHPIVKKAQRIASGYRHFGALSSVTGPSISGVSSASEPINVFGTQYLSQAYTGHFFVFSLPKDVFQRMTDMSPAPRPMPSSSSSQEVRMPTLLTESTGFTATLPLPVDAYSFTPLSREQQEDKGKIQSLLEYLRTHSDTVLDGFHPQGHDDVAPREVFRREPDANVSSFYRHVVWAYEVQVRSGTLPPKGWILGRIAGDGRFSVGLNYRHLMQQDERCRFVASVVPDNLEMQAADIFYSSQIPQLMPQPPQLIPSFLTMEMDGIAGTGEHIHFDHPTIIRIYRPGFASEKRLNSLMRFMKEIPRDVAQGSRLVLDLGGSFPVDIGAWSPMDDHLRCLRMEFYL